MHPFIVRTATDEPQACMERWFGHSILRTEQCGKPFLVYLGQLAQSQAFLGQLAQSLDPHPGLHRLVHRFQEVRLYSSCKVQGEKVEGACAARGCAHTLLCSPRMGVGKRPVAGVGGSSRAKAAVERAVAAHTGIGGAWREGLRIASRTERG